ncbi:MAG TPA: hypothetical protein PLU94_10490 [Methanoregulaceae archaeon]|nr:hypothetical protein [Methanoregulaceae archaeon]
MNPRDFPLSRREKGPGGEFSVATLSAECDDAQECHHDNGEDDSARSPKISHPMRKAITDPRPRAPQFTWIAMVHLLNDYS